MRYYVEINGESSLNIQGLMIQSLPSISKPLMRSKQETIDGRDGDIVTKLGYSAYDKTLKIGLWGNYDINEIIAFFNQEGEIVFSNEPDKYYRFTILNRDDYVSQLDKFRTCTIALHCQPYKYKLNEEAEELENEYIEQEGTSLTFNNTLVAPMNIDLKGNTLQNGTPTPSSPIPVNNVSGDNQVVVCGKNLWRFLSTDYYNNQNISSWNILSLDKLELTSTNGTYANVKYKLNLPNGTYTFKLGKVTNTNSNMTKKRMTLAQYIGANISVIQHMDEGNSYTINIDNSQNDFYCIEFWATYETAMINTATFEEIQIEKGSTATTYEAYNGTTYNIDLPVENLCNGINQGYWLNQAANSCGKSTYDSGLVVEVNGGNYTISTSASQTRYRVACLTSLPDSSQVSSYNGVNKDNTSNSITIDTTGYNYLIVNATDLTKIQIEQGSKPNTYTPYGTTPIELNKIGTYQDYIYKENDKWYLHKEINKIAIVSGGYLSSGSNENFAQFNMNISSFGIGVNNQDNGLCNYFKYYSGVFANTKSDSGFGLFGGGTLALSVPRSIAPSGSENTSFATWLENHQTYYWYKLATPTNTEITYQPLIEQLESIKNAMSKAGTTNVNQVNNDLPFMLDLSVLSGTDSITLTNEGNATSKPTLTITGSGVVGVYLENIQMFNISLGTNETIIIDTENMEAYYGSQLKNRQVTGDYSKFALQSGTNNLKFTGLVTNVKITNYNRWI